MQKEIAGMKTLTLHLYSGLDPFERPDFTFTCDNCGQFFNISKAEDICYTSDSEAFSKAPAKQLISPDGEVGMIVPCKKKES